MKDKSFSELQIDALQEISNIGLGHAATSLAEMLDRKIDMGVPHADFVSLEKVIELIGGYEELVSCVSLELDGDINGLVFYIFNESSTYRLVDMLMGLEEGTTVELDEMATSIINEIGNILTGAFVSAISDFTQLRINTSVPIFAFDMLAAIFTTLVVAMGRPDDDSVMSIETNFFREDKQVNGHFFLLAEPESIHRLFSALGIEA
ncbi:chemotaxis protein CheC [Desulfotruncus alcoholivorax]|uniref:chemotaxis protein CheC n=1 Tax=Desulfotruncus alcoholivorax TaxID=265477 RepID=UPI000420F473|nr:chemotaxis protein CheC [Desulfotruncus alcoholivorax]